MAAGGVTQVGRDAAALSLELLDAGLLTELLAAGYSKTFLAKLLGSRAKTPPREFLKQTLKGAKECK